MAQSILYRETMRTIVVFYDVNDSYDDDVKHVMMMVIMRKRRIRLTF